jgi:hypothetical protein
MRYLKKFNENVEDTNVYDFPSRGIKIKTTKSSNNVFMIKNINDVSEHGNIGLFSIASYDSQFTLKHYYNVPLLPFNLPLGEHGKWVSQKWEEFCELNKIKNSVKQPKWTRYTSVQKASVFPKRGCELKDFLHWLQKNEE